MKTADQWFELYGASHQNPLNKLIHWFCIPLIVISLLGLLASIPSPVGIAWLNPATLLVAFGLIYYWLISPRLAVGMVVVVGGMLAAVAGLAALSVPLWVSSLAVFVLAWVVQFVGHKIEGKKPSFLEDVQFLMIGPLWLLGFIYRRLGISY